MNDYAPHQDCTTPNTPSNVSRLIFNLSGLLFAFSCFFAGLHGQEIAKGGIAGRVSDADQGNFLQNVRLTIEGTGQETFTDDTGRYRIMGIEPGLVKMKVFFTGVQTQTATIEVTPGEPVRYDISLSTQTDRLLNESGVLKLEPLVIAERREMDGAAIAINEQRFAVDNRTVIAANEFGPRGEGELGEVLQFLPGVSINSVNGNAYDVSIDGVPSDYVPVRVNGFDLASARETTSRMVVLQAAPTTHSLARIEVLNSPTPESPGSALAGSINLVPLSAFERARPEFNARAYLSLRDDVPDFNQTAGPGRSNTRKVHPGFNFTYIAPINARFGVSLSGGTSRQYVRVASMGNTWAGVGTPTNGTTLPDTTSDRPYLTSYNTSLRHKDAVRYSVGATFDYRITPNDRISLALQYVKNTQDIYQRTITYTVGSVAANGFTSNSTAGVTGRGNVSMASGNRRVVDPGFTPTLTYRHDGADWKIDAGIGRSQSSDLVQNLSLGNFFNTTAQMTGVTIGFDGITDISPGAISVTRGTGATPVDPNDLRNYQIVNGTGHVMDLQGQNRVDAYQQSAYLNIRHDFSGRIPFSLKGGLDIRQNVRDLKNGGQTTFTYVGADGVANTSDDVASAVIDEINSGSPMGFGPSSPQWVSPYKLYDLYKSNPNYFTINRATEYTAITNGIKKAEEIISSGYLRGDLALFSNRLKLVGGVRVEQTNIKAEGPLSDVTRNYQYNAAGVVIRDSKGVPLKITSDPLEAAKLTLIERGTKAEKEYLRWFPSLNASYELRNNLIFRAAYSQAVGRPNFNQYAGGVTLPDTEAIDQSAQVIRVNNAGIKAWSSRSVKLRLEYYFKKVGLLSVGVFRRDIKDFFGNVRFAVSPEFLALYGLPQDIYGQYDVITQHNVPGLVRMEGFELNYKQALTFLPHWARGVQVFANHNTLRATGDNSANFDGFVPKIYNGGISLSRQKFSAKANWNFRSRIRSTAVTGRSIAADTYRWTPARTSFNFSAEYRFAKHYAFFTNFNSGVVADVEILSAETPALAHLLSRSDNGGLWTFGVSGSF